MPKFAKYRWRFPRLYLWLAGVFLWGLLGCQSSYSPEKRAKIEKLLRSGQYAQAAETHSRYRDLYKVQDELLFYLNQSSLDYYRSLSISAGQDTSQNQPLQNYGNSFEQAESILRYNDSEQNSFAQQSRNNPKYRYTASLQESLWHNIFASLYYWNQNSLEGSLVELRRNHEKVRLYRQYSGGNKKLFKQKNQQLDFRSSALMEYLGMIYYREDLSPDDWRISRDKLKALTRDSHYYPNFPDKYLPAESLKNNHANINFVVFTGAGVRKDSQGVRIIKVPGGVALQLESGQDSESVLGFRTILIPTLSNNFSYYEMMVPVMLEQENHIDQIIARIDGRQQELYPLEPFAQINMELFRRLRADFLPKQITAFILKVVASEAVQAAIGDNTASLLVGLFGSVLASSPPPDLRVANFNPSVGWVGELQIPSGYHDVELLYYSNGNLVHQKYLEIVSSPSRSQIVQDYYAR